MIFRDSVTFGLRALQGLHVLQMSDESVTSTCSKLISGVPDHLTSFCSEFVRQKSRGVQMAWLD